MNMLTGLVLIYLVVLMWFGFCGRHHASTGHAFLTNGGRTGALLCALSLVSTIIGGSATLGMGGLAQKVETGAFWWLGVGAIGLLFHGWLAPKIRALPAVTLPEVVGVVAGKNAERWAGIIIAVSWIAVTAAQFVALHTLLMTLSSPLAAEVLYVMIAGVVIVHTITGGQSAVIRTDAFQAVLLLGGFTAAAFWLWGDRPDAVASLDPIPFGEKFGPWEWGKMMLLVGITYIVGPDMFSRTFSARDGQAARFAAWLASPCLVWFGIVVTALALLNLQDAQPVAGWLSDASAMPAWLKGVLALGLISALCGSADTVLLSASGIVERSLLAGDSTNVVRFFVGVFGIAAAAAVYVSKDIIWLLLTAYSLFVPGVALPLLIALIGKVKRLDAQLWTAGSLLGGIGGLAGNLTGNELWTFAGMGAAAVLAIASRVKAPKGGSVVAGSLS